MSETPSVKSIKKPMHKFVYFVILLVCGYVAAMVNSLVLYFVDEMLPFFHSYTLLYGYRFSYAKETVKGVLDATAGTPRFIYGVNEQFNFLINIGWPVGVIFDLFYRLITFNPGVMLIWAVWALLFIMYPFLRRFEKPSGRKMIKTLFYAIGILLPIICAIICVITPDNEAILEIIQPASSVNPPVYTQVEYKTITSSLNIFVASYQLVEYAIVASPLITFLLITDGIGEFILRRQIKAGTFLMDQFVPSFDYVD